MNWQRLELWITISFGIAVGAGILLLSVKRWVAKDWWLLPDITGFLSELGNIVSG